MQQTLTTTRVATVKRALYNCYKWTNPATGNSIYYKQTPKITIVLNELRKELSIKPKDWLLDIPQHRDYKINVGLFNEKLKQFLKEIEYNT